MTKIEGKRAAILLLGAPGAGKGTQGAVLGSIPRFLHYASGDVFRALDTRTPLGRKFVEYSSRGELVPDEVTVELWAQHMDNMVKSHSYKPDIDILVLDGTPRTLRQCEMLEDYVEMLQIFHLSCPNREELARRLRKRALKEQRLDDASEEVIQRRIQTYEDETKPILDYYPDEIQTDINADETPAQVTFNILAKVLELPAYQKIASVVA